MTRARTYCVKTLAKTDVGDRPPRPDVGFAFRSQSAPPVVRALVRTYCDRVLAQDRANGA